MSKKLIILLVFLSTFVVSNSKTLTINKTSSAIAVDGDASDWGPNWISMNEFKGTTTDMSAKFQIKYNDNFLYIIVQAKDGTPNNDVSTIQNTWERDCIDVIISMDTTVGDTRYKEGSWQIRMQRTPEYDTRGIDGNAGILGGGNSWSVGSLLNSADFKVISTGDNNPYTIEWAIPWNILTAEMSGGWNKTNFRFDIYCTDNATGDASGRSQMQFWNSNTDQQWNNTSVLGIITLGENVNKKDQTITFNSIPELTCGNDGFLLSATSSKGLPVTFTSSNTAIAQIKNGKLYGVGVGTCIITASQAGNDSIKPAENILKEISVMKGSQTIILADSVFKTYGDADFSPAKASTTLPVSYKSTDESVASIVNNLIHIKSAGIVKIKAWQAGNASYNAADTVVCNLVVGKATIKVVADNQSRSFGQKNPVLSVSYSGFKFSDGIDNISKAVPTCIADTLSPVGTYNIELSIAENKNYKFNLVNGKLTINKALLKIKIKDVYKTYGDVNPAYEFTYEGKANGDNGKDIELPKVDIKCDSTSHVGAYDVILTGASAKNYIVSLQNGTIIVIKAPLYVIAEDNWRKPSEKNPAFTLTYGGFVNNEDTTVLKVMPQVTCSATSESPEGVYDIVVSGGVADNYVFIYKNAKLKIGDFSQVSSVVQNIGIYPNPAKDIVYFSDLKSGRNEAAIYTIQGKLVTKTLISNNSINIKALIKGAYVCTISNNGKMSSVFFVKE